MQTAVIGMPPMTCSALRIVHPEAAQLLNEVTRVGNVGAKPSWVGPLALG